MSMTYWNEDVFEGRYAVKLVVDTGDSCALPRLADELDKFAQGLNALGYRIEVTSLLAARPRKVIARGS